MKTDPAYHHLPVFFLTSEYENSSLLTVVTYGAAGLLKKPTTGPEIHAYLQKRMSVIEEGQAELKNFFPAEAKPLLSELQPLLPLKNPQDLASCLHGIQKLRAKANSAKWPLLAYYSQKIEAVLEATLEKEVNLLAPISALVSDYTLFIQHAVSDLENSKAHALIPETVEINLKNYQTQLEAGWFASAGLHLSWEAVAELERHLSPEGQRVLQKYLPPAKKKAA